MSIRKSTQKGAGAVEYSAVVGLGAGMAANVLDGVIDNTESISSGLDTATSAMTTQLAEVDLND